MKKFADKGGVDLQGAVPHIFVKDGNDAGIVITEDFIAFKFRYEKDSISGLRARFRQPVSIHL